MGSSVRLGKVLGVEIDAHWSLLLIAGLILLGLASNVLPDIDPGRSDAAYWVAATLIVIAFYVALAAHELAHSLVARRRGIEVRRITLWLFGGVSELTGDSQSAVDELQIAIVGPITSMGLGIVFSVLALLSHQIASFGLVTASLAWLGVINIVLGLFNLLPAFPLDGGRVVRAALWAWRDDEIEATEIAARISKYAALGLVGLGVAAFLMGAGISGLWLAILGWFVLNAARMEASQAIAREALTGVTVGGIMTEAPVTVPTDLTVADLIERFVLGHRHSCYPVVDGDGRPVGLMTLDTIRQVDASRRSTTRLAEVMMPLARVLVVAPDAPAGETMTRMLTDQSGRALVVVDGRLVGIISLSDIVRAVDQRELARSRARGR